MEKVDLNRLVMVPAIQHFTFTAYFLFPSGAAATAKLMTLCKRWQGSN